MVENKLQQAFQGQPQMDLKAILEAQKKEEIVFKSSYSFNVQSANETKITENTNQEEIKSQDLTQQENNNLQNEEKSQANQQKSQLVNSYSEVKFQINSLPRTQLEEILLLCCLKNRELVEIIAERYKIESQNLNKQ